MGGEGHINSCSQHRGHRRIVGNRCGYRLPQATAACITLTLPVVNPAAPCGSWSQVPTRPRCRGSPRGRADPNDWLCAGVYGTAETVWFSTTPRPPISRLGEFPESPRSVGTQLLAPAWDPNSLRAILASVAVCAVAVLGVTGTASAAPTRV